MCKYFKEKGSLYRFQVVEDLDPCNPRDDDGNIGHMMVWWNRYSLGDENDFSYPGDFIHSLVSDRYSDEEFIKRTQSKDLSVFIRKADDKYILSTETYEEEYKDSIYFYQLMVKEAIEELSIAESIKLLEEKDIVLLSLQCGWIWTDKETVFNWCGGYRKDGKFIPLTEANWKDVAKDNLKAEVKTYDQYLCGEVYGYIVDKFDGEDWEYYDSCYGFYSDKIGDALYAELSAEVTSEKLLNKAC